MTSQSRLTIKTHVALRVGIGAQNFDILPNKSQITDFLNRVQSECCTGFSGGGIGQSEPDAGLFYPKESSAIDRVLGFCSGFEYPFLIRKN
jgi:hypothetical protein